MPLSYNLYSLINLLSIAFRQKGLHLSGSFKDSFSREILGRQLKLLLLGNSSAVFIIIFLSVLIRLYISHGSQSGLLSEKPDDKVGMHRFQFLLITLITPGVYQLLVYRKIFKDEIKIATLISKGVGEKASG
ncbi:MAG: hypothetical protein IH948_00510 [Bacteroidetes bacterium]|nr:hypothetical protein [Bacteroidota bacterium]